jgi:hypothetical protein
MSAAERPHADVDEPAAPESIEQRHTDPIYVARSTRYKMSRRVWPADILPAAWPHVGTLPLAVYLGARPEYASNNVWYQPCMSDIEQHPPLVLDPAHREVRQLEQIVRQTVALSEGNYFVGMPALLGGIDVLAELRGTSDLLVDMIENPHAVHQRLREIQDAYVQAFDRMYAIVKIDGEDDEPRASMCYGYFMLWGRGKVGLCQCDTAAMFSPKMFGELVVPYLREQCAYLDRSMFHIDGAKALIHLEMLLDIADLDAIEFTPDPKSPGGGDARWYPLYRRILERGKSVWVANLRKDEVLPLLDAIGGQGVYVSVNGLSESDAGALGACVDRYRS